MPTVPFGQDDPKGLLRGQVGASMNRGAEMPSQTNLMMAAAMEHQYSMSRGEKAARPTLPGKSRRAKLKVVK